MKLSGKLVILLGVSVLLTAPARAQRNLRVLRKVPQIGAGCPPVSQAVSRQVLARAMGETPGYLSSAQLFKKAKPGLTGLTGQQVRALQTTFEQLDDRAVGIPYDEALFASMARPVADSVIYHHQVQAMTSLLNIQAFMKRHNNEFPSLLEMREGKLVMKEGARSEQAAVRAVMFILHEHSLGHVSPAVAEQLALLHAKASNAVPVQAVAQLYQEMQADRVMRAYVTLSLRNGGYDPFCLSNLPTIRGTALAMEVRLLQLTPGLSLPKVLKTAQVTY